ncbi:MAG TPA: hypothetical protein ENN25_00665, partial [Euryarchaeota archaeon]|nr:hypothetical protein [Euryarchaeota archaeon]
MAQRKRVDPVNAQNRILRLENHYGRSVVRHGLAFLRSINLDYRIDTSLGQYSRDILSSMQKLSSRSLGNEAGNKAFERAKRETAVEDIDTIEDFFTIWSSVLRNVQHIAGNTGLVVLSNTIQRGDVASPVVPSIVKCSAHFIPDLRRDVEIVKNSWEPCTFALTETDVRLLSEEGVRNIALDKVYEIDRRLNNLPEHPGSIL